MEEERKYGTKLKVRAENKSGTNAYFAIPPRQKFIIMQILGYRRAKGEKVFQADILCEMVQAGLEIYLQEHPNLQKSVDAAFKGEDIQ